MKKRIFSAILSAAIITSCVPPTTASALQTEPTMTAIDNSSIQTTIAQKQTAHKITFPESVLPEKSANSLATDSASYAEAELEMNKIHNADAAQQAKNYVKSLDLSDSGFGYIEDFCLEELDYYKTMEDAQLTSYTVYTPNRSSEATLSSSPSESDLTYFGSYGGRKFYFFYPSSAGVKTNIQKQSTTSKLQSWINNILGCTMVFADIEVSALWSSFQLSMGAPDNYIVQSGAFTQSFCNLTMYTRGIYTQYGNGDYDMLTSQQFCNVYPYMVFHPVDSPNYAGSYNKDYGFQGQVFSPKYKNSTTSLCKEAWQLFNGTWILNAHDRVNTSAFKTIWENL